MSRSSAGNPDNAPQRPAPREGRPAPAAGRRRHAGLRRRSALDHYSMHFGPNMTPMVDVVMVILVFFMASAAFLGNEWFLRAAIPSDAGRGGRPTTPADPLRLPTRKLDIVMEVDAAGATVVSFLQISRGTVDQVIDRINALPRDESTRRLEVVIKPTPLVAYRDVVRVHAACDAAGIEKVGIGVTRGR